MLNTLTNPLLLASNLIVLLIGMTIHEFAHNYVAYRMGDPVPEREGRLTLNPMVHINWIGWLMFAIIGFGILGSAPISANRMRNPRWGFLAAVAAGPLSNLLLAAVFAFPARLMLDMGMFDPNNFLWLLVFGMVQWNVLLFIFNLIPLFPIDGWHIVHALLPPDIAYRWSSPQWIQYSQYAFFGALLLSFSGLYNVFGLFISQPTNALIRLLLGL